MGHDLSLLVDSKFADQNFETEYEEAQSTRAVCASPDLPLLTEPTRSQQGRNALLQYHSPRSFVRFVRLASSVLTEGFHGIMQNLVLYYAICRNIDLMSPAERSTRHILVHELRVVGLGPSGQWLGSLGGSSRQKHHRYSTAVFGIICDALSLVRISGNFPGQMHGIPPTRKGPV